MVVRKQLCMNTLISLLLFSIATQLVRFIAGRLSLAQVGHWCLFGTSEDALDINPTFVFSSSVSQCLQGDVQAGCFSPFSCFFVHGCFSIEPPVPGPCPGPSFHILVPDSWTDIQIIAGVFHRHDRKLLVAAWCLFYDFRQRRKFIGISSWPLRRLCTLNRMPWFKQV